MKKSSPAFYAQITSLLGVTAAAYVSACATITGVDFDRVRVLEDGGAGVLPEGVSPDSGLPPPNADGTCPSGLKLCADVCASVLDARVGCNQATCTPCAAGVTCTAEGTCAAPSTPVELPPECQDGARDCGDASTPRLCVDKRWQPQPACGAATPVCADGKCAVSCTTGTRDCLLDSPRLCAGGEWLPQSTCTGATPVCTQGRCTACVEGAAGCSNDTPRLCVAGVWKDGATCAGAAPKCENGGCYLCVNGSKSCAGETPRFCQSHAWQNLVACVGQSNSCSEGTCATCRAGFANCDGAAENGCETELDPPPNCGVCGGGKTVSCFRDADGDGFGAKGSDPSTFCGAACAAGWSSDATDCDDKNRDAHPGQTQSFSVLPVGATTWDMNCDGVVVKNACDRSYPSGSGPDLRVRDGLNCRTLSVAQCAAGSGGLHSPTIFGWEGSAPDCGEAERLQWCDYSGSDCATYHYVTNNGYCTVRCQ